MRHNDITPDEVVYRKTIDGLKSELATNADEARVRTLVVQVNVLVHKSQSTGTNAIKSSVAGVDLEEELSCSRQRLDG